MTTMNTLTLPEPETATLHEIEAQLINKYPEDDLLISTTTTIEGKRCSGCSGTCEGTCRGRCDGTCIIQ